MGKRTETMTVTKIDSENEDQLEGQVAETPSRQRLSSRDLFLWAMVGLPLLLFTAAALTGLGFFLFTIPALGTIAAILAVVAGVLTILVALILR